MTSDEQLPEVDPAGPDVARADAEAKVARVHRMIGQMVDMMVGVLDDGLMAVATKLGEILNGLIAAVKEEDPAWSIERQADWARLQINAIRNILDKLKAELPGELRAQLGSALVDDNREMIDGRIAECAETTAAVAPRIP